MPVSLHASSKSRQPDSELGGAGSGITDGQARPCRLLAGRYHRFTIAVEPSEHRAARLKVILPISMAAHGRPKMSAGRNCRLAGMSGLPVSRPGRPADVARRPRVSGPGLALGE